MPGTDQQKGSFLGVISPWGSSRSSTSQNSNVSGSPDKKKDILQRTQGEDHTVTRRYRLSQRHYPEDCPPLNVRWFYAVDSPKRKPIPLDYKKEHQKPPPPPKKFVPFSSADSQSIELAFQKLPNPEGEQGEASSKEEFGKARDDPVRVPVNEDYLFDVDVDQRELSPAYWVGPVYEVRRGTWFFQEGSTFKPCEENLATQLEEGFIKVRPWRFEDVPKNRSRAASATKTGEHGGPSNSDGLVSGSGTSLSSAPRTPSRNNTENTASSDLPPLSANDTPNHRLFGAYMNSIVTYQDASTAWLTSDDFMSRVSTTVYQKLGGVGGTKVIRGFSEYKRPKDTIDSKNVDRKLGEHEKPRQKPSSSYNPQRIHVDVNQKQTPCPSQPRTTSGGDPRSHSIPEGDPRITLERQMSSLAGEPQDTAELEEQARIQEEREMEDSREVDCEDREREIDHLVLVSHGIGQRLGLRLESINFIHDVNSLRKTLKSVYKASPDLQALNFPFADSKRNCRVQVLPVCWRHLLDFPYRGVRQNRKELDLADADEPEDDMYPSLADVTLDGVPAVRNLISDLAMDVLLYQSAYCDHIARIVQQECNRIFNLFKKRNPSFRGTVSLCGHSLGSAILFDILGHQQRDSTTVKQETMASQETSRYPLDFECDMLFCLGSPIALFQMLKGKTIAGRTALGNKALGNPMKKPDEFLQESLHSAGINLEAGLSDIPPTVSSPKCRELYNIFHPSDPVSYRIEPLISPAMATLKPQPLPSVKRSLWAASGQSLSVISTRVGQSVGSLWSNFTSGVASSLLNRSLGLSSEDVPHQIPAGGSPQSQQQSQPLPASDSGRQSPSPPNNSDQQELDDGPQAYIDQGFETLYRGFQNSKHNSQKGALHSSTVESAADGEESDDRARRLKMEDAKVRALNTNGRVDYSLQEGTFDISLIASIASHLSYWADEDVNHFVLSQLLSGKSRCRGRKQAPGK